MANTNPLPLIHSHHLTTPQQTLQIGTPFHSTFQTNNPNNWLNNNNSNNNDCHHLMKSNVLHEGKMVARDFLSTVRPYYLNAHSNQWTDLPVFPPHPSISSSSSFSFQQPAPIQVPSSSHYMLHVMQVSPHHVTVCPSLTPEGESAFSDRSSMTSSKVHDDGLQGHWDQDGSMNDSARDSTAFPDDDDDWSPVEPHDGSLRAPRPPGPNAPVSIVGSCYDDKEADGEISYKWDVYDILREGTDLKADSVEHVDMELCSVASNGDPEDPEDPERGPIGDDGPKEPKSRQEGLSETELLCFLRLLDKRDRGCSVRYTIQQFVTCIPVTDVENLKHRTAALSRVEKETYDRLMRLAPKASRRQVVHAMDLLPFILKSMGESALTTTATTTTASSAETRTKDRPHRRSKSRSRSRRRSPSRSRSRSSSLSRRRRRRLRLLRENSWSPDRNRLRGGRRHSPSVGHRKTFPGQRFCGRGGRSDFAWKREQRRTAERDGRTKRWEEGKRWRREFPRQLPHRLRRDNEATSAVQPGHGTRREKSGAQLLRKPSGKSAKKSSPESCSVGDSKKKVARKSAPGPRLQRKTTAEADRRTIRRTERMPSFFSETDLTSVGSVEGHDGPDDPGRISAGSDSPRPGVCRAGLLPTPGTTAYRAVMERAATTRLRGMILSRRSVSAESELL